MRSIFQVLVTSAVPVDVASSVVVDSKVSADPDAELDAALAAADVAERALARVNELARSTDDPRAVRALQLAAEATENAMQRVARAYAALSDEQGHTFMSRRQQRAFVDVIPEIIHLILRIFLGGQDVGLFGGNSPNPSVAGGFNPFILLLRKGQFLLRIVNVLGR